MRVYKSTQLPSFNGGATQSGSCRNAPREVHVLLLTPVHVLLQILQSLRQLSCLLVSKADLEQTLVAHSVRRLRKSSNEEVQRVASKLIDKWKQVVLMERPAALQHEPQLPARQLDEAIYIT